MAGKKCPERRYIYLGDKLAKMGQYVGRQCTAALRQDGKCIRGKNSNMLVYFDCEPVVVLARMLRKIN